MAHFAELDEQNTVIRVVVISNDDILDENGQESEALGVALCSEIVGPGIWVQTSFNNNFRKLYGQPGMVYVPDADVFYNPVGPYPSWTLDDNYDWQPPTPMPDDGNLYYWDEDSLTWVEVTPPAE
jgi:hypothetical protein